MNMQKYDRALIQKLEDQFYDIPFGNSAYQVEQFVLNEQMTPARAYRAIGLNMLSIIDTLKLNIYKKQCADVKLKYREKRLRQLDPETAKAELLALKIDWEKDQTSSLNKLINDAIMELNAYYEELRKYPEYTRNAFEDQEKLHFHLKLNRQLETQDNGAVASLLNVQVDSIILKHMLENPAYLGKLQEGLGDIKLDKKDILDTTLKIGKMA